MRVLNKETKIKDAHQNYLNALIQTNERRELWQSSTKNTLIEVLEMIAAQIKDLNPEVQRFKVLDHLETVNIVCGLLPSGHVERGEKENGPYINYYQKEGGCLSYSQSYNGKIHVMISYPFIEKVTGKIETTLVATMEPKEITEDVISDHFITFMEAKTKWEGLDVATELGFKQQYKG